MNIELTTYHQGFLDYLKKEHFDQSPGELYDPINYILGLGGKRMRPILVLAAAGAFDRPWQSALPAALGIEIFHNFTLIHDDIMDEADLRRGKPTSHKLYGRNAAILSGDAMMLLSLKYILRSCDPENRAEIVDGYLDIALQVCIGQQWDMNFESLSSPSLHEYLHMIEGKTAVLPAEALRIGALIGGSTTEQSHQLFDFGLNLGLAFQMQDDWLDLYGDAKLVGKVHGGDILQKKKTILFVCAFNKLNEQGRKELISLYNTDDRSQEKIARVRDLFNSVDVEMEVQKLKQAYHDKSLASLEGLNIPNSRKEIFHGLANTLLNRKM